MRVCAVYNAPRILLHSVISILCSVLGCEEGPNNGVHMMFILQMVSREDPTGQGQRMYLAMLW